MTFINTVFDRPRTAFAGFAVLHAIVWTALPALLWPNLPLDLIEAVTYGREWQLGYDKLPPLPWWLAELGFRAVGHDFAFYALSQLAVLAAFAAVWTMARALVGPFAALFAVLLIDGQHYFSYTAPKFNHDVVQLPFWALAGLAYWRALRFGRERDWLLLGLALGGAFWAKYFVVVLAAPLVLFLCLDGEARRALRTPGPYLAALVALVVATPHLVWLIVNDFAPLAYAEARSQPTGHFLAFLVQPVEFSLAQLLYLLPMLPIALPLFWPRQPAVSAPPPDAFDGRIVTLLAFGPFLTLIAMSLASGRNLIPMWGYPLWLFLGLWLMMRARTLDRDRFSRALLAWAGVFGGFAGVFAVSYGLLPSFDHRYRAVLFPGRALARELTARFASVTGRPLAYVIAEIWSGGNVGHYGPTHPRVLIDDSPARAPWIDLADLAAKGAAVMIIEGNPIEMRQFDKRVAETPGILLQQPFTVPSYRRQEPIRVLWAIIPPK